MGTPDTNSEQFPLVDFESLQFANYFEGQTAERALFNIFSAVASGAMSHEHFKEHVGGFTNSFPPCAYLSAHADQFTTEYCKHLIEITGTPEALRETQLCRAIMRDPDVLDRFDMQSKKYSRYEYPPFWPEWCKQPGHESYADDYASDAEETPMSAADCRAEHDANQVRAYALPALRLAERNRLAIAVMTGIAAGAIAINASRIAHAAPQYYNAVTQAIQDTRRGEVRQSAETAEISENEMIGLAEQYSGEAYEKDGMKRGPIVQSQVYRCGDSDWHNAYSHATSNSSGEYPATYSVKPEDTIVVYQVVESGDAISVAIDRKSGRLISMEVAGDN